MKRYASSFLIALSIYTIVGIFIFYTFKNENLIFKEIDKPKTISLKEVELKPKKIIEEKQTIQKEEVIKEEKLPIPEKIVEEIKKEEPIIKKKPIPKEVVKKEIIKKTKEIKKEPVKKAKTQEKIVENPSEIVKETSIKKEEPKVVETKDIKQEYLDKHLAKIRKAINENIIYPKRAKKLNIQGIVTVKFKILENGSVTNIEVLNGHKFLQKATIEAIENASKSFPKVKKEIEIQIPIEFKLI